MSLSVCFKKNAKLTSKLARLCLIQRQNSRYLRCPVWKTKSW